MITEVSARALSSSGTPADTAADSTAEQLTVDALDDVADALTALERASGAKGAAVIIDDGSAPPWVQLALGPPPPRPTLESVNVAIAEARAQGSGEGDFYGRLCEDQGVFVARFGSSGRGVAVGLPGARMGGEELGRLCLEFLRPLWPRLTTGPRHSCPDEETGRAALLFPSGYAVGISPAIRELHELVRRLANSDVSLLITGETGVGKELVARLVHRSSYRRTGEFLALNCAALPFELFESELFGIGSGVASGVSGRSGLLEKASGGTLLLDEIGDLPASSQTKLLRALQEKSVRPLGRSPVDIDVRVLSATNSDLRSRLAAGSFRLDLYYRIAGYVLTVPPLRERVDDIPILVNHVLAREARTHRGPRGFTLQAMSALCRYPWPGNVRELENRVRTMCYMARPDDVITLSALPSEIRLGAESDGAPKGDEGSDLAARVAAFEREELRQALAVHDGNKTKTARTLGLSRSGLAKKLKRLGIEV